MERAVPRRLTLMAEKADLSRLRSILRGSQLLVAILLLAALVIGGDTLWALTAICFIVTFVQVVVAALLARVSEQRIASQKEIAAQADQQRAQIEQLFTMTDMLQSATSHDDAGEVLSATAGSLLPDLRGALYIFNNSQDRLDLSCLWPDDDVSDPVKTLVPANCWALKRGKPHVNDPFGKGLCCKHNGGRNATLEVPMVARGKVHGLLMLASDEPDGAARLHSIRRIAQALADSMSLALANIALQEKLRTQSLRDPLTGLYNRRYMEDALERYLSIAERNGSATSVIMIDLDHFKRLNDCHGHAKGDAVLRDVAAQLAAAVRPADIVARYGGEELMVIMPGCDFDDAMLKAEVLRSRIEGLSEIHGTPITASFGVASVPTTSIAMSDLLPMADSALYAAKQAGRNCVQGAPRRHKADQPAARLAVAQN